MGLFDKIKESFAVSITKGGEVEAIDYNGPFSMVKLGGYVSPSGGYVNYATFEVIGTNAETK